jgi:hypothetical protein
MNDRIFRTCSKCDKWGRKTKYCEEDCLGRMRVWKKCKVESCTRRARKDGVCRDVNCGGEGYKPKKCKVEGCTRMAQKDGLCRNEECTGKVRTRALCSFYGGCPNGATGSGKNSEGKPGIVGRCRRHGGGPRCNVDMCPNGAVNSSRKTGEVGRCIGHGGGNRCEELCCTPFPNRTVGRFIAPNKNRTRLCSYAARNMIVMALLAFNDNLAEFLTKHFGFNRTLLLRAEHIFYFELVKRLLTGQQKSIHI